MVKNKFKLKKNISDIFICFVIGLLPFGYHFHLFVPEEPIWETKFFTINSYSFENVNYMLYVFASKALLLVGCLIWFYTCRHWWRNVILIPIVMTFIQIIILFDKDLLQYDEIDYLYVLPLAIVLMVFMYWFGKKLKYASKTQQLIIDIDQEIAFEIEKIRSLRSSKHSQFKTSLELIRRNSRYLNPKEYVLELMALKSKIISDTESS